MNSNLQVTAVIRDRWQITIPGKIRQLITWLKPNSVVTIKATAFDGVVIQRFSGSEDKLAEQWNKALEAIKLARSFAGKRGNLSNFVMSDRESH